MKQIIVGVTTLLFTICITSSVSAYAHANRWGGSTSHSFGDTSHTSAFGSSTSHAFGVGTSHTNVYGGTTAHGYDGGTVHTTPYGATAYRPPGSYYGYHPPTTVNYYGSHCYNCGSGWAAAGAAVAGAAVGAAAGAAAASSSAVAATSGAYSQGYMAGATAATAAYAVGNIVATLPAGCGTADIGSNAYYVCNHTWFRVMYGANGVYYKVVPAP
jgi:hypothetical protein